MQKTVIIQASLDDIKQAFREEAMQLLRQLLQAQENSTQQDKEFFTIKEAAKFLRVAVSTIYSYTHKRLIPFFKRGKKVYFKKTDLFDWINSGEKKSKEEICREGEDRLSKRYPQNE